jgi:CheY-like chemotaxis protein
MTGGARKGRMHILLAEDNEDHALITELAIRRAQPELDEVLSVATVSDGREALAYLRGEGAHAGRLAPDLVLMDIKMPGMTGLEVLRAVRQDASLPRVPVIMLTTSAREADVEEAYRLGANEYVTKPVRAEEFRTKVQAIPAYWSKVVTRPATTLGKGTL